MKNVLTLLLLLCLTVVKTSAQVNLMATGGTTTASYTTLAAAFNAINAGTHTGVITLNIASNTTEAGPCVLNSSGAGAASYASVLIQPSADAVAISGATATGRGLIELNGADNVTINGDNPGTTGINRNLTITNTAANTVTITSVIRIALSTLVTSSDNVAIKNCNINGSGTGRNVSTATAEVATFAIIASIGASTVTATTAPSALASGSSLITSPMSLANLVIDNNNVQTASRAIVVNSGTLNVADGLVISNNIVGNATAGAVDQVTGMGICVQGASNGIIRGNTVRIENYLNQNNLNRGIDAGTSNPGGPGDFIIEKNRVERIIDHFTTTTTPTNAYGINCQAGGTNTIVRNNFVGELVAGPATTGTTYVTTSGGVLGIRIAAGTGYKVYHNTVSFSSALPAAAGAGLTACLGVTAATITGCDIRNNIFSNFHSGGNASTNAYACIYLPSGATSAMGLIMNNNALFQGTTAVSAIGQVGATVGTGVYSAINFYAAGTSPASNMRAYTSTLNALANNDSASLVFVSAPPFVSSTDFHIPAGTSTSLESAGASVAATSVTSDIDGDNRPGPTGSTYGGATAPDLGADEFDGTPANGIPPSIAYTPLVTSCSTGDRVITATISDTTGIPTSGTLVPRIYFKKNSGAWFSAAGTQTGGTSYSGVWSFTISATAMSGLTGNDVVSYYIIAQDADATPNVSSNPWSGLVASNVNTVTTPPTTVNTYTVIPTLSGTYTVGAGQYYTSLTAAVNAYNASCLGGNVTFLLTDASYSASETFPIVINRNVNASPYTTLTIKPQTGVASTITGSASAAAVIKLLNAQYVTIDGLNTGGSSLTINNGNTGTSAVVWLASTVTTGPGNKRISLLNTNMVGGAGNSATNWGIISGVDGATPAATNGMDNDSVIIQGNSIKRCGYAIWAGGTAATAAGGLNDWVVKNNILGSTTYNTTDILGYNGVFMRNMTTPTFYGNTIRFVGLTTATTQSAGVYMESGVVGAVLDSNFIDSVQTSGAVSGTASVCGIYLGSSVLNTMLSRNRIYAIYNLGSAGGYGARAIIVNTGTAASNATIVNNFISDVFSWANTTEAQWPMGIAIDGTGTGGVNVYNNTVNLWGAHTGKAAATGSACMYVNSTATGGNLDIRNNLFVNTYDNTAIGTDKSYAIYSLAANTVFSNVDYNDYYVSGAPGVLGYIGATARPTLGSILAGFGGNTHSVSGAVPFVSPLDLHVPAGSATVLESAATPIAGVVTDIDNQVRPGPVGSTYGGGTTPDIGADEFDGIPTDATPPSISYTTLTNSCSTSDRILSGVAISDLSGVPTTGSLMPRIYFKKNSGAWISDTGTLNSGTGLSGTWTFTISATAMGGLTGNDVVSYYVIAQDLAPTPNVGAVPGTGIVASAVNAVTTAPTAPNTFTIIPTLSGTYTVGAGQNYTTLTAAVNAYNTACLSGNVTFVLTDANYNTTSGESFPIIINRNPNASPSTTLTIKPQTGVASVISSTGSPAAVIKLLNAQYVTIDGVNAGGSSLALSNGNTGSNTAVVWLASTSGTGPGNKKISLLNMNMTGGAGSVSNWGIIACVDGTTPTTTGGMDNDSVTIQGNTVKRCGYAVMAWGIGSTSAGGLDSWLIKNNIFGAPTYTPADIIAYNGVFMQSMVNPVLSGNTIRFVGLTTIAAQSSGVYMQGAISGAVLDSNIIDSVQATFASGGTSSISAIYLGGTVFNTTVSRNKIFGIYNYSTGGARAITVNTGSATSNATIVNNFISDVVSSSSAAAANWPSGVAIDGSGTGGVNVYNNSINLYGTHAGANAATGSACLYVVSTATGGNLDVRNNVFVNSYDNTTVTTDNSYTIYSQPANTVFSNIDFNDYYVSGSAGVLGYVAGTAYPTLAGIISGFGGNTHSINSAVPFVTSNDLHIPTGTASSLESAGIALTGVTTDIDNQVRPGPVGSTYGGGTITDIGADEFDGVPIDGTGPLVSYTALSTTVCGAGDRTISGVSISDFSGVPTTGSLMPRIYFKKNTGAWVSDTGTLTSGTRYNGTWSFTISATAMGGLAIGDVVSYYVIAQDMASTPNLTAVPGAGLVATNVNTVTTPPTTPNVFTVTPTLGGTYTVGVGGAYTTLTAAINDYNSACLTGPVVFSLISPTYPTETYPIQIGVNPYASSSATLTIKPAVGVSPVISGNSSTVIFKLVGADYVTFDGSNTVGGTTRDLTITNTNTGTAGNAVLWIASATASDGATNNTIKNCIISGNSSTTTEMCIYSGGPTGSGAFNAGYNALSPNSNTVVQNNTFMKSQFGVWLKGINATSTYDQNTQVADNNFGTANAGEGFNSGGLIMQFHNNANVSRNVVQNVVGNGGVANAAGSSIVFTGIYMRQCSNDLVSFNKIFNFNYTGTGSSKSHVIYLESPARNTAALPSNITVANNVIYDARVSATGASQWSLGGISTNAGYGDSIYYNTVNLTGLLTASAGPVAAFSNGNPSTTVQTSNVTVKDNIFSVKGSSATVSSLYATYWQAAAAVAASVLDYNDLNCSSTGVAAANIGYVAGAKSTLAAWQTAVAQEAHSINTDPLFVYNYQLQPLSGNLPLVAGTPIAGITTDFLGNTRSGTTPVIGAHEVNISPCGGALVPGVVAASVLNGCATFNSNLTLSGSSTGSGLTVQWQSSADSSTWTNITGETDLTYSPSVTATTYYRATVTCGTTSLSDVTAGLKVISNPLPTISGVASTCVGSSVTMSATPAGGTWVSGATATATIDAVTGNASGVAMGTAPITYTSPVGCTSTGAVVVASTPSVPVIAPSTAVTCEGVAVPFTAASTYTGAAAIMNSGTISVAVPDASATGAFSTLTAALPAGAVITGASVKLNGIIPLTTEWTINLTAPNGNTLNLFNRTGSGANFVNTIVSSTGGTAFTAGAPPYTGTFAAAAATGSIGVTAYPVNVTTWASLYSVPSGNWTLSVRDFNAGNTGALTSWTLTLNYTSPASVTWSPAGTLYTDAALSTPYTGTATSTVYAAPSAAGTAAAVNTYTATASAPGCSVTNAATAILTVNPLPADIAGANTVCVGSTTTLTSDATGGTWSSSFSARASIGSATGIVTGVAAGVVSMTYTKSATGCFKTMQMTVNPLPSGITGTRVVCEAATTTLADADGGGAWSTDAASVATVGTATGIVAGVSAGFAQITYTLPTSCRLIRRVTVNAVPTTTVSPTPLPGVCFGGTATLTANTTMNNFALMSQDFNNGLGAWTITNIDGNAASYWQLAASPGYFGVTGDGSQMIQAAPDAYMGITNTRFTSPSFSTAGYGAVTLSFNEYLMSLGTSDDAVDVEYSTDGGTLWNPVLSQIDEITGSGSWTSSSPEVSVALPAGAVGQPNVKLRWNYYSNQGLTWAVDNIRVTAAQPAPTYAWSGVSGATGLSCTTCASVNVTPAATGANVYSIVATTTAGCVYSNSATVTVNPLPSTIGGTLVVCQGDNTTATDVDAGGTWSTAATPIATIDASTGEITGVSAGTAEITYTLPTGCTTTAIVTVNATPAAIDGALQVCQGLTTTLSNTDPGGAWSSSASSIATISSGVVSGVSAGTATISYAFVTGCMSTVDVTVNPLPANIGGTLAVCEGLTTTLTDGASDGSWSSSLSAIAGIGSASGVVAGNLAGTTSVTYTLPTGCVATATVTVNHTPVSIGGVVQVCEGLMTTLSNTDLGGTWSSGSSAIADIGSSNGVVIGSLAGTSDVTYTLPTGCITTATVTVNHTPVSIGGVLQVCEGLTTTLSNTDLGGTWSSASSAIAGIGSVNGVVTGNSSGTTAVTYTLPAGCTATATVTVNHTPVSIGGVLQVCEGSTTSLSNTDLGGTWSNSATGAATVDAGGVVSGLTAGNTTITYKLPTGCMTTSVVTVNPLPAAISGTMLVCQGVTSTLTDGVGGGTWSSGATSVATIGSSSGIVTGVSAGFAPVRYTTAAGCYVSANVTVNATPAAVVGTPQMCVGSATTLTDSDPGGSWASSAPAIAYVSPSGIVSGMSNGTATITYALSAACIYTTIVTVDPLPAPIVGPSQLCVGATGAFTNGTAGGTWTSSTPVVATIDIATGNATAMGSGITIITYISATGCVRTRTLTVNALPAPVTGLSQVCMNGSIALADATPGGSWSSGAVTTATISSAGLLSGVNAGVAPVTYTLPTGCTAVTSVTVNQIPGTIGGTTSMCMGQTAALSNGVFGGTWSSGTPANALVDAVTGVVTGVGVGSSLITYTLSGGCSKSAVVVVNEVPSGITGATNVCQGTTTTMTTASTGGAWTSSTTTIASINLTTGVVTGLAAGTANISYTMLSGGCNVIHTITVDAMPAAIAGAFTVCSGQATTLGSSTTGGTWSSSNMSVATIGTSGVVSGVTAGTSVITYVLPSGCMRSAIVTVNALPAVRNVTGGGSYCAGGIGVHVGLDGSDAGMSYRLYNGVTAVGSAMPGTGSSLDFGMITAAGTYTVLATNTSAACTSNMSGSAPVVITTSVTPTVAFTTGVGDTVCSGLMITFTTTAVNGGSTPVYQWQVNGTNVGLSAATYSYMPVDGDIVSVQMTSSASCAIPSFATASKPITVQVSQMPVATMTTANDTVCMGTPVTFNVVTAFGGSAPTLIWVKNGISVAAGMTSFTYTPVDGDSVYVKMSSDYRCRLADTVRSAHIILTVDTPQTPMVTLSTGSDITIGSGQSVTFTATTTHAGHNPEFQWNINGYPVAGATTDVFTSVSLHNNDSVTCVVTNLSACAPTMGYNFTRVKVSESVRSLSLKSSNIKLMPNPNKGEFAVKGTLSERADKEVAIEVTNRLGQVVYKARAIARNGVVDEQIKLNNTLANGMYMLNLIAGEDRQIIHFVLEQ